VGWRVGSEGGWRSMLALTPTPTLTLTLAERALPLPDPSLAEPATAQPQPATVSSPATALGVLLARRPLPRPPTRHPTAHPSPNRPGRTTSPPTRGECYSAVRRELGRTTSPLSVWPSPSASLALALAPVWTRCVIVQLDHWPWRPSASALCQCNAARMAGARVSGYLRREAGWGSG
jgi:hypothetical protein